MGTRLMRRFLGILALTSLPCPVAWAQVPAGPEFRINTYTTGPQHDAGVAVHQDGSSVAVWTSFQNGGQGIHGQRFDSTGAPVAGPFQVSAPSFDPFASMQGNVVGGIRGAFLVLWVRSLFTGDVFGRRYDGSGSPLGPEFLVSTFSTDDQEAPRGATDHAGNTVVVWTSTGRDGSVSGVFGQRHDPAGTRQGQEFQVNTYTTNQQAGPFVDFDGAGNFVVVWSSYGQDGNGFGAFGQRFSAAGAPLGSEFQVNTYTTGRQDAAGIHMDAEGNFVVVWSGSLGLDGDHFGVFARRYDRTGTPLAGEFQVNTYTTGLQINSSIDGDESGNFVISWRSIGQDGGTEGVFGQRFDSAGAPRGSEFRVNTYTSGVQNQAAVASDGSGNFVVAWQSQLQDGSQYGVFAQRFGGLLPAALVIDSAAGPTSNGNGVFEAGETVAVAPSWRNVNGAAQTFTGVATAFTGPGTPGNPTYTIADASASYGAVANGATASCATVGDCMRVGLGVPTTRPVTHWDATLREDILPVAQGQSKTWALHVGDSFTDVLRSSPFYRFVETLLHRGVTAGCSATQYCPTNPTSREQMAVFVLVAKEGAGYLPPACGATPMFGDVPASSPFCRWIEELARRGVVGGCGGGNYCPASPVSREQMSVFVLLTLDPAINPPACAPPNIYNDLPETNPFCRWVEELTNRGVVSGCGGGNYCPASPVSREQMGVFISVTFGLTLYGP